MGRRRRRAAVVAKAKPKLDTQFDCPYCNSSKSVEVKMSRPESLGQLKCRVCNVSYQTRINYLNEPVDVYSEWIDESAERQRLQDRKKAPPGAVPEPMPNPNRRPFAADPDELNLGEDADQEYKDPEF
ncbi:unnamed protein product [Amoebophrya sp. A25]|nr:unnamed protein product [Amoebophrya sp. A25]|eukprot:GSA25T00004437001.1